MQIVKGGMSIDIVVGDMKSEFPELSRNMIPYIIRRNFIVKPYGKAGARVFDLDDPAAYGGNLAIGQAVLKVFRRNGYQPITAYDLKVRMNKEGIRLNYKEVLRSLRVQYTHFETMGRYDWPSHCLPGGKYPRLYNRVRQLVPPSGTTEKALRVTLLSEGYRAAEVDATLDSCFVCLNGTVYKIR